MTPSPRYPRDIPPLWLLGTLLGMAALHAWLPVATVVPSPWSAGGYGLVALGVLLVGWAAGLFRRRHTGIKPFTPATALVESGPFRFTRNPMYIGVVGIATGAALAFGTLTPCLLPPALWWVLDRRFVRREEAFLRERFGSAYDRYTENVRRWL